jgi:hypothetical protein
MMLLGNMGSAKQPHGLPAQGAKHKQDCTRGICHDGELRPLADIERFPRKPTLPGGYSEIGGRGPRRSGKAPAITATRRPLSGVTRTLRVASVHIITITWASLFNRLTVTKQVAHSHCSTFNRMAAHISWVCM